MYYNILEPFTVYYFRVFLCILKVFLFFGTLIGVCKERKHMKIGILRIVSAVCEAPLPDKLAKTTDGILNIPNNVQDCTKSYKMVGNRLMQCIITEDQSLRKIEVGDRVYDMLNNEFISATQDNIEELTIVNACYERVLKSPDEFEPHWYKRILNWGLSNGDAVILYDSGAFVPVPKESKLV